ncbi:MAG: hypothetical protein B7Z39_02035 [Novosphingobium sp. 12-64-8]|nr:MAG: hypothetical protein B7Z39_02035 [Novosphingobium sp. 12-64-8]
MASAPVPPSSTSLSPSPFRISSPAPALIVSASSLPFSVSAFDVPLKMAMKCYPDGCQWQRKTPQ